MSSGTGRPILAARTSSGDTSKSGGSASGFGGQAPGFGGKAKRTLIESACAACRRRKSKCDGVRPTCSRCASLRTDCIYEAEEGESRWAALRRRAMSVEAERDDLLEIFNLLRSLPEPEALDIFHRIRNSNLEDLVTGLRQQQQQPREGSTSFNPQQAQQQQQQQAQSHYGATTTMTEQPQQRLPPIRSIFDVSGSTQAQIAPGIYQPASLPSMPSLPSESSIESYGSMFPSPYEHPTSNPSSRHPSDQDPG